MSTAPPPGPRRPLHLRRISCEAFERDDGLLDIEGLLIDTKPGPVQLLTGRNIDPGAAIHQMRVRLTVDRDRWIVASAAYSEEHPYQECAAVEAAYQKLVGLRIEPGFTLRVKQMFRGEAGCTHISELIPPMATVVFQVLWADSDFNPNESARPSPLGSCHGLRWGGEVARAHFSVHRKKSQ
ncbi:MAG: hypothetical protein BGO13_08120 [Burkholderiales bacterium 66-5]|nr:MAG: hypothetical protein BGO13_08120 [Burkholderiales bacterium 66-5]